MSLQILNINRNILHKVLCGYISNEFCIPVYAAKIVNLSKIYPYKSSFPYNGNDDLQEIESNKKNS